MTEEKLQEENLSYLHLAEALSDAKKVSLKGLLLSREKILKIRISSTVNDMLEKKPSFSSLRKEDLDDGVNIIRAYIYEAIESDFNKIRNLLLDNSYKALSMKNEYTARMGELELDQKRFDIRKNTEEQIIKQEKEANATFTKDRIAIKTERDNLKIANARLESENQQKTNMIEAQSATISKMREQIDTLIAKITEMGVEAVKKQNESLTNNIKFND